MPGLGEGFNFVFFLDQKDVDYSHISKVGGKNASLGELRKSGFNVPPGFCVISDAYAFFIRENNLWQRIEKMLPPTPAEAERASREIRDLMESFDMPKEIDEEIRLAYRTMVDHLKTSDVLKPRFSVRSSGTAEDLPTASFAGQFDTFLWIEGEKQVIETVKKCWSSLFTARGIEYRETKKISHEASLMSVGIQLMVDAKAAGVIFTLDPVKGDRSVIQIEANWGLGESVVKGNTPIDTFKIDKISFGIRNRSIQEKVLHCVPDHSIGQIVEKEVPPQLRSIPCLGDKEIIELAKQAKLIEKHYKRPQDIEFAIDRNPEFPRNIFILQSRPETKWSQRTQPLIKSKGHVVGHLVEWLVGVGLSLKDKTILVVDDEIDILETIVEELSTSKVHKASDYDSAMQFLLNENYDIVVLDIMGVNGLDLLQVSVARGFPTVMLTAHAMTPEFLGKSRKLGAAAFLPKEKLPELSTFLEDVILAGGKPIWIKLYERLGYFFAERFGQDWEKKAGIED